MENLRITESVKQNLLSAAKWLKFLTVLATIGLIAFVGIVGLFTYHNERVYGIILSLLSFALCYYPIKKCYNIVNSTREAMNNASQDSLESGAANLRSLLRYIVVLTIVVMAWYALAIILLFIS